MEGRRLIARLLRDETLRRIFRPATPPRRYFALETRCRYILILRIKISVGYTTRNKISEEYTSNLSKTQSEIHCQ